MAIVASRITGKNIMELLQDVIDDYCMKNTRVISTDNRVKSNLQAQLIRVIKFKLSKPKSVLI